MAITLLTALEVFQACPTDVAATSTLNMVAVINDGEQTTTSKGTKPQESRDLTWKTPSTREGKTTGASQTIHYVGSLVTTPTTAAYKKRMNQSPMENPNRYL
jgi:hypothetical protein